MPTLLERVREEHLIIADLIERLHDEADAPMIRRATLAQLHDLLRHHAAAEEKLFYPLIADNGLADRTDQATKGVDEHREVLRMIDEMAGTAEGEDEFERRVDALAKLVATHVDDEELRVFSMVRSTTPEERLKRLGAEWPARLSPLLSTPGASTARPRPLH